MVVLNKNMPIVESTSSQKYTVKMDKRDKLNVIGEKNITKSSTRDPIKPITENVSACSLASSSSSDNNRDILQAAIVDGDTTSTQRLAVLSFDQVRRLDAVMNEVVSIQGRGNFPTIEVSLKDLVNVVRNKLEEDVGMLVNHHHHHGNNVQLPFDVNVTSEKFYYDYNNNNNNHNNNNNNKVVKDIRLNGGAASYVLDTKECWQTYNDLDLIFAVELSGGRHFDRVKTAVLNSLLDLLPAGVSRKRISTCSLKEAYVSKMVKVNQDGDCWSLISLGNSRGLAGGYSKNVELKFVDTMKRPFEFSVDSFQIVLDSLLLFYDERDRLVKPQKDNDNVNEQEEEEQISSSISETYYPTVVGDSVYGDYGEALYHLQKKLIATRNPEEIRGGGLLKYCNLLVRNYQPAVPENIKMLERYMCSRFFIDFPDINQQRSKLENYLLNHFVEPEEEIVKYQYLLLLRNVVDESTVCLMGHERRQTLSLIDEFAYNIYYYNQHRKYSNHQHHHHHHHQQHQHHGHHHHHHHATTYVYSNGYYYTAPAAALISPCCCNSYVVTHPAAGGPTAATACCTPINPAITTTTTIFQTPNCRPSNLLLATTSPINVPAGGAVANANVIADANVIVNAVDTGSTSSARLNDDTNYSSLSELSCTSSSSSSSFSCSSSDNGDNSDEEITLPAVVAS